jgi:hypothetical protein
MGETATFAVNGKKNEKFFKNTVELLYDMKDNCCPYLRGVLRFQRSN